MNVIRPAVTVAALAALATAGVAERGALHTSFALLGHLEWIWIPVLIASESVSMAAFALMFRRLLAAGVRRRGPAHARHHLRCQRAVRLGAAGRARAGHGLHLPPFHPAGRGRSAGRLVAAGRGSGLLGRCGRHRGWRRAVVWQRPGHDGRRARRGAGRGGSGRTGRGRAPSPAPPGTRRARDVAAQGRDRGCAAGLPAIRGPRSGPGRSGWGRCACPPRGGWR